MPTAARSTVFWLRPSVAPTQMTVTKRPGSLPCGRIPGCATTATFGAGSSPLRTARLLITFVRRRPIPVEDVPERARPSSDDGRPELWASVQRLPAKQRSAIALRFLVDASHAQIAEVMGTSEEAARRNVHEGLKRLRTEYRDGPD